MDPRRVVEEVAKKNCHHFSSDLGQGTLSLLARASETRWAYLTELLQNALDAGAKRIRVDVQDDTLSVEHDGPEALTPAAVRALASVGGSTKGLDKIGFMGVGFKSVFKRVQSVSVSGFGWSFRFHVEISLGPLGDRRPDWLGAVCPTWDENAPQPSEGYTTRFSLSRRIDTGIDFDDDVDEVFGDATVLAVLAHRGLAEIILLGRCVHLSRHPDASGLSVAAQDDDRLDQWRVFVARYTPSAAAVRQLLETRRPHALKGDLAGYETASREREVVGIVPLDASGMPVPPETGDIFATMPTTESWPFGMHLQADWLLGITRAGLPELEQSEWQEDILAQLPGIIGQYLQWVGEVCNDAIPLQRALTALANPGAKSPSALASAVARPEWLARLRDALAEVAFVPVYEGGQLVRRNPRSVRLVPPGWQALGADPDLHPELLFGTPIVAESVLGSAARELLVRLGLLVTIEPADISVERAPHRQSWWSTLESRHEERMSAVEILWAGAADLSGSEAAWRTADLVLTESGTWGAGPEVVSLPPAVEGEPENPDPATALAWERLRAVLPRHDRTVRADLARRIRTSPRDWQVDSQRRKARHWIESVTGKFDLTGAMRTVMRYELDAAVPDASVVVRLSQWLRKHGMATRTVLAHLVVEGPEGQIVVPAEQALIADPYVADSAQRKAFWSGSLPIVADYLHDDLFGGSPHAWAAAFEAMGASGPLRVKAIETTAGRYAKPRAASIAGMPESALPSANDSGYTIIDFAFNPPFDATSVLHVADLIDAEPARLQGVGRRRVKFMYYTQQMVLGGPSQCAAVLTREAWVPTTAGSLARPASALSAPDPARPDAPVAKLQATTIALLEREGIRFGSEVPRVPEITRLRLTGHLLTVADLSALLRQATEAARDPEDQAELLTAVTELHVPVQGSQQRVPLDRVVERLGIGFRSDLGGWLVSLDRLEPELRSALQLVDPGWRPPSTTTGWQALRFLQSTWRRAAEGEGLRADELRERLAAAYSYVFADARTDASLRTALSDALPNAWVYCTSAGSTADWWPVRGAARVYFDDQPAEGLREFLGPNEYVASPGHLGRAPREQREAADRLQLAILSDTLGLQWLPSEDVAREYWSERYLRVWEAAILAARGEAGATPLQLRPVDRLVAGVRGQERFFTARIVGSELRVAGEPADFALAATQATLNRIGAKDNSALAMGLALILRELDDLLRWRSAMQRFLREHGLPLELSQAQELSEDDASATVDDASAPVVDVASDQRNGSPELVRLGFASAQATVSARPEARAKPLDESAQSRSAVPGPTSQHGRRADGSGERLEPGMRHTAAARLSPSSDRDDPPRQRIARASSQDVSASQTDRGERGEREFLRRLTSGTGWGGLRLIEDVRARPAGYDFQCQWRGSAIVGVEVKTFAAAGRIMLTENEMAVGREMGLDYLLVGFLDDAGAPEGWRAFAVQDPIPSLERIGEWRNYRRFELPALALLQSAQSADVLSDDQERT